VAFLAREERLKKVFSSGGDIHRRNASVIFKKAEASITGEERQLAKTLVHAANYGIGARKFAQIIGRGEEEARRLLNLYYVNYPSIKRWHIEVESELRRSRTLTTPMGRKRTFFERWGPDLIREAIAFVPQSVVSDIMNYGIIRCSKSMPREWELLMQNHDAVLFQVPSDTVPIHILKFIGHYFTIPIPFPEGEMVIPIEVKVGPNWGDLHKLTLEGEKGEGNGKKVQGLVA
jgi:DNA polymerase-1